MKAYDPKKRLTATHRDLISAEVVKRFDEVQDSVEKVVHDRVAFMFIVALGKVATDELHFGAMRRSNLIESVVQTANKISDDLKANTCEDGQGNVGYDIEWNREILSRYAKAYGLVIDERLFDDDYMEDAKNAV